MTEQEFTTKLTALTLEQLNRVQDELLKLIQNKKEIMQQKLQDQINRKQRMIKRKSVNLSNDVNKMADELGLDLSGLMRDIARH